MKCREHQSGFTLVELLVTLVVLAVIATLAAPSFADAIDRARIKSQVMRVVDVIQFAKSEALKHNTWGSTARIDIVSGSSWVVKAVVANAGGAELETKTTDSSEVRGVTLAAPTSNASITLNFRGVLGGYVGDTEFITLQSARNRQVRIRVNPVGNIIVCAVGEAFGGYSVCPQS